MQLVITFFSAVLLALVGCRSEAAATRAQAMPASSRVPAAGTTVQAQRTVAFTFDDLPASRDRAYGLERMQKVTAELLDQLQRAGIPAVGFVNESKLDDEDEREARTALLEQWLDAGMELGNHTYSHPKFWDTPLEDYQQDVLRGERATRRLLAARGQRPRFFRHPYLNTGPTPEAKDTFERFLAEHGYRVAPVTIDNMDVMYALAYDNTHKAGDTALMRRIGSAYIDHMRESFAYFEQLSRTLLGREPAQVLMLHANALNAEYLDELVSMLQQRGYRFIPLETALEDAAYELPDTYIGERGHSWLQRWAITRGTNPGAEPRAPQWVERVAYP
jgi:peptidoglycan/xylan/chitin deacetylase (PgdA/CDA1 family)